MPDTYISTRSSLLDSWFVDGRPRLQAIRAKTLDLLESIEAEFQASYDAAATADVSASATDVAGAIHDMLSNCHARWQRSADNRHLSPDMLAFDQSELEAEHTKWKARSEARDTRRVG